jgi:hypothetical protein
MRKCRAFSALIAIVLAASPLIVLSAPEPPAAVLLGCRGDVVIVRSGGEKLKGSFGMALEPGDEVRTGNESVAEIHFDNGQWVQIGENSSTQVHGRKSQVAAATAGEKSFQVVQNFIKLKDSQGTSSIARLRSGEKHPSLRALSPFQTKIRETRPTFRWDSSGKAVEVRLVVYDEKGIHWKKDVPAGVTECAYPADAPALDPTVSYSWVVETSDPLVFPALRSEAGFFEVLPPETVKELDAALADAASQIEPSGSAYHVFCASIYFDHGLMENAIAETSEAIEIDPENPDLHAILARLYAETGRTQEALREYDQLLDKR